MERFWGFFIKKRQFSYLVVIAALIFGALAIISIPKESAPEVRVPVGIVTVSFPGASALDVEQLVTSPLEDRLAGSLENVDDITSTSRESISSIVVEFLAEANLDASIQELRDAVDEAKVDLPEGAEDPIVTEVNFADQPILTLAIGGTISESELQEIGEKLKDELTPVQGVSNVIVGGARDKEIRVVVRQEALQTFGITLTQVESAIRSNNSSLPVGSITTDSIEYTVQFEGRLRDAQDVRTISVGERNGSPIYLSDIADIFPTFSEKSSLSRVSINGQPSKSALTFDITKRSGGNIADVTAAVREKVAELEQPGSLLHDLQIVVVFDSGELLKEDLLNLTRTGFQTIFLVMATLFLAIGWRESLLAGIAIPFSFLIGFIALEASGNTINFISLFSLILAVGILVDSAIVMVEGIHTNMRRHMDKQEAALRAIHNYHSSISAGTLTTIAVFAPLFFISGITGEFIASIPFTIIFVLLASLLVALGIVPLFASFFLRRRITSRLEEYQEVYTEKLQTWYKAKLQKLLRNGKAKRRFVWGTIALLAISIMFPIVGLVNVEFFPQEDVDFITLELEQPQGTVLELTDLEIRKVEELLYENKNITSFVTTVGASSAFTGDGASSGSKLANIFINLEKEREKSSTRVVQDIRDAIHTITTSDITVSEPNNGPPTGSPIVVRVQGGDDIETLDRVALDVEALLERIEGTANVRASTQDQGIEFTVELDRAKAASLGITPVEVASVLRTSIHGTEATSIKNDGQDIDVIVTTNLNPTYIDPDQTNHVTAEEIKNIQIQTSKGTVLLSSILSVDITPSRPAIAHENRERVVHVTSDLDKGGNVARITRELNLRLGELSIPESIEVIIGGENEDAEQAFRDMFLALILGVILMLAVLVLQFNSYRYAMYVLSVLPFSLIGVFFGLLITGQALSFTSMLGFIALSGIIVNNSIILIDVINKIRFESPGKTIEEVVIEGSALRLRPIMLTTVTTVIGLIPLAFVSALWSPLATAIIFGLLFSVTITLFLVPTVYHKWPGKVNTH